MASASAAAVAAAAAKSEAAAASSVSAAALASVAAQSRAEEARLANQITYSVTGDSGAASITYSADNNFSIAQESDAALPWSKDLTIPKGDYRFLSISAQNSGDGDITCSIAVGGKVVNTITSSGAYAIATCNSSR
jgi:hypothetical protein